MWIHNVGSLCTLRLNIDLTSEVKRRASKTGKIFNRAVSDGSANQDFIGIALPKYKKLSL